MIVWRLIAPMAMSSRAIRRNAPRSFAWTEARTPATRRTRNPSGERVRSRRAIASPRPTVVAGAETVGSTGRSISCGHMRCAGESRRDANRLASVGQCDGYLLDTARGTIDNAGALGPHRRGSPRGALLRKEHTNAERNGHE